MMFGKKKESFILPEERKKKKKGMDIYLKPAPDEPQNKPEEEQKDEFSSELPFEESAAAPEQNDSSATAPPDSAAKPAKAMKGKKEKKAREKVNRMPFYKDRLKLGILLIAVCVAFGAASIYLENRKAQSPVTIVTAVQDISAGQEITSAMVTERTAPSSAVLSGQIMTEDDVIGKRAKSSISQNQILLRTDLSGTVPYEYLYALKTGEQAISVAVADEAASLSYKLMPGDIVTVYVAQPGDSKTEDTYLQPAELTYMRVLATANSDGWDLSGTPEKDATGDPAVATVTLLVVNENQATTLLAGSASGLHFALVTRGDDTKAQQLLAAQQQYLETAVAAPAPTEETPEGEEAS